MAGTPRGLIVSDLAAAEFASALAVRFRARTLSEAEVRNGLLLFDTWQRVSATSEEVLSVDIRDAGRIIRTLEHALKTPDATHIVIARRLGAALATFDVTMAREARRLGLTVAGT